MNLVSRLPRAGRQPLAVWLLLLALLWAPLAGSLHGVLHGAPGGGAPDPARLHSHDADASHGFAGLAALFGDHDDEPSCRLYDGAAGGDAACVADPVAAPAAEPVAPPAGAAPRVLARAPQTVRARGPPHLH